MIRYFIESRCAVAAEDHEGMVFFREKALIKSGVNPSLVFENRFLVKFKVFCPMPSFRRFRYKLARMANDYALLPLM